MDEQPSGIGDVEMPTHVQRHIAWQAENIRTVPHAPTAGSERVPHIAARLANYLNAAVGAVSHIQERGIDIDAQWRIETGITTARHTGLAVVTDEGGRCGGANIEDRHPMIPGIGDVEHSVAKREPCRLLDPPLAHRSCGSEFGNAGRLDRRIEDHDAPISGVRDEHPPCAVHRDPGRSVQPIQPVPRRISLADHRKFARTAVPPDRDVRARVDPPNNLNPGIGCRIRRHRIAFAPRPKVNRDILYPTHRHFAERIRQPCPPNLFQIPPVAPEVQEPPTTRIRHPDAVPIAANTPRPIDLRRAAEPGHPYITHGGHMTERKRNIGRSGGSSRLIPPLPPRLE